VPEAPVIVTDRLRLRGLEERDLAAFAERANRREVYAMTLRMPSPYRVEDARQFMLVQHAAWDSQTGLVLAVCLRDTDEPIGSVGLEISRNMDRAELGYWIAVEFWGRGYATEASAAIMGYGFERLALHRIAACHFVGNEASKRVIGKLGMTYEGTHRQSIKKDGVYRDDIVYAVLREEYRPLCSWSLETQRGIEPCR
jgi:RimJ/RimL family protein N-acetyltransferase